MAKILLRLEFDNIYPDEEKKDILEYLKLVSKFCLENFIGFFNVNPTINYDNFFSNSEIKYDVIKRVNKYCRVNNIEDKPVVISPEASLKISEFILANKDLLITNKELEEDIDRDEINLFKSFLSINEIINKRGKLNLEFTEENIDKIAEIFLSLKFSTSDLGLYDDNDFELLELAYTTSYKFEKLIDFLSEKVDYNYLVDDLCNYFKQTDIHILKKQVDFLIIQVLRFTQHNSYKFKVIDPRTIDFLDSLIGDEIIEDKDFIHLRNYPLYRMGNGIYTIINTFFVLDKFTKSIKFLLKDSFNRKNNLDTNDRGFFNFYNKEFSENYLMKNLLDSIFYKKHFVKQEEVNTDENQPDYYFRHNKDLFIFEYKDVLIAKDVKVSGDVEQILQTLEGKFLKTPKTKKRIGIGQLISHIEFISSNKFVYDTQINDNKFYTIYPILLLSDRTLEMLGVNHILNNWFIENLEIDNKHFSIKNLVIINIDTLIFYEQYLKQRNYNFKDMLDTHIKKMKMDTKGYGRNQSEYEANVEKKISTKLAPFSYRFNKKMFDPKLFINSFSYLVNENNSNF
ncbi:hypothetical protein [Myroides sp. ZB35]|uniref:hypothetical protein n=1 Tax=Myroides sp. ZB35 TaxID=1458492 RepID=UPI0008F4B854|nr:hypothetical protein [Myroides sp. ZB35]APA92858.1 hypothetical protein BK054_11660 [Myroides sp. ZB35]